MERARLRKPSLSQLEDACPRDPALLGCVGEEYAHQSASTRSRNTPDSPGFLVAAQ